MSDQKEAVRHAYNEMAEIYAAERSKETDRLDRFIDSLSQKNHESWTLGADLVNRSHHDSQNDLR